MASIWSHLVHESNNLRRDGGATRGLSLSVAAIVGIAICGSIILFVALVTISVYSCRWKHRRRGRRISEANEHGHVDMNVKATIKSTRPPEVALSRRLSFNPFLPLGDTDSNQDWGDDAGIEQPTKAKRTLSQKAFFRVPSVRESWPLATTNFIPLALLPNQSTMILSPVAPPGYIIEERGPNRSTSRLSRRKSSISVDTTRSQSPKILTRRGSTDSSISQSPTKSPKRLPKRSLTREMSNSSSMPHKGPHRRATSETQLTTILRSTSERLKAAHRHSLTRTLTTIAKFPGMPPPNRLPTPPRNQATESREELIDREYTESLRSSLFDCYLNQTPSPGREPRVTFEEPAQERPKSPTPSGDSGDSLYADDIPDVVIPAPLSSPSKSLRGEKRCKMRISSDRSTRDIATMIQQDSRASVSVFSALGENSADRDASHSPHRISLSSDPFDSSVRNPKPVVPNARIQGPRPMYFRKATFGHEATSDQPASFCSPLRETTGNAQLILKKKEPSPLPSPESSPDRERLEPNPFQWEPQEAMHTRATQTSPKNSGSRRRGHKRSNVVRMSNLSLSSRPPSICEAVNEEEEPSKPQLHFNIPTNTKRGSAPPTSPTPSPPGTSGRRFSLGPPSSVKFEPALVIPDLGPKTVDTSPTLGLEDMRSTGAYSTTLSGYNYYAEQSRDSTKSKDEFFNTRPLTLTKRPPSRTHSQMSVRPRGERRHSRKYSAELKFRPDVDFERHEQRKLFSFPPPNLADHPTPILSPPPSGARPLPNITSTMTGYGMPVTPLLTTSLPFQLSGLSIRPDTNSNFLSDGRGDSPPRNSLHASINALRRMNSEASQFSSSVSTDVSPDLPGRNAHRSGLSISRASTLSPTRELKLEPDTPEHDRGRSRSSKYYLTLGSQILTSSSNVPAIPIPNSMHVSNTRRPRGRERAGHRQVRDSHRVHKERRRRRFEAESEAEESDNHTPRKDRTGGRGMDWEFDDGTREWDAELTPVKEISSPLAPVSTPSGPREMAPSAIRSSGNALGIMGLRYPILGVDTERGDIHGGVNSVTPQELTKELEVAKHLLSGNIAPVVAYSGIGKSPLGFGFEAFRPVMGRPASSCSLTGPVLASQAPIEPKSRMVSERSPSVGDVVDAEVGVRDGDGSENGDSKKSRWSDAMTKPTINVARRESKMEHPAPQQTRWVFSALGIPGLGFAAARLLGSGNGSPVPRGSMLAANVGQKTELDFEREKDSADKEEVQVNKSAVEDAKQKTEEVERLDSISLYDQDGFLRSSPDREIRKCKSVKERVAREERASVEIRMATEKETEVVGSEARMLNGYVM